MIEHPLIFEFVAPSRIVFGCGRLCEVGDLVRSLGRRAFIVHGSRTLESNGTLGQLIELLRKAGVEPVRMHDISHEPLVADVDALVERLRDAHAGDGDLLLAIGGGSAIDLAKAAAALVTNRQSETVRDFLEGVGRGLKIVNAPLPVLAMPTTGGTGTEATKNAVLSSYDPPFKKSLRSDLMVPRIVLIDPELAISLSPRVTAFTGMDAITQLIESYISRRATPATQSVAWLGLRGTVPALLTAFRDGSNRGARETLARAALYSGIALANSGLGMAHGVAAALGVHCRVPHGLACAIMLPATLRANLQDSRTKREFANIAVAIMGGDKVQSDEENLRTVAPATARIDMLLDELLIPRRLSEIGVKAEQIPAIVRDSRGNSMSGNPRDVSDEELTRILEEML